MSVVLVTCVGLHQWGVGGAFARGPGLCVRMRWRAGRGAHASQMCGRSQRISQNQPSGVSTSACVATINYICITYYNNR